MEFVVLRVDTHVDEIKVTLSFFFLILKQVSVRVSQVSELFRFAEVEFGHAVNRGLSTLAFNLFEAGRFRCRPEIVFEPTGC